MYEPPIRLLVQQLETSVREQQEKQIFEAIQKCGVDVDRDELIKALAYDRGQYDKGYADGHADGQRWSSVEARLPETCKETRSFYHSVTVFASETGRIMIGYFTTSKDDGSFDFSGIDSQKHFYDFAKPSHWMPLPEPPAKEATP